jgi:hypothetical protein
LVEVDQLSHNLKSKLLIEEKKAEIKECRDKVDILKKSENLSLDPLSLNEILNYRSS